MQNLIKSRAVFEILKKPLPEMLQFYRDGDTDSDCEDCAEHGWRKSKTMTAATEATAAAASAKLNVNASVFQPRSHIVGGNNIEDVSLGDIQSRTDGLEGRKPTQPKLMLPWKGFPKIMNPERSSKPPQNSKKPKKLADINEEPNKENSFKRAQPDKESSPTKNSEKQIKVEPAATAEKRRELERKVALDALKLVEQRRLRESMEQPQAIVHLTREPVDFTPEERLRVDRLRIIKRANIERILREMRQETEAKKPKDVVVKPNSRYVCLQRAVKPETLPKPETEPKPEIEPQPEMQPKELPVESAPPKRYIPTVKQWDERCRAKANKENTFYRRYLGKLEENAPAPLTSALSSQVIPLPPSELEPCFAKKLFVPRYRPPAPVMVHTEQRRGNLTHACNISRAFPNCGLLPTPGPPVDYPSAYHFYENIPLMPTKPIKRYDMKELLQLEPQPHEIQKPHLDEALYNLGFIRLEL